MNKIIKFINDFKSIDKEIISDLFNYGYCYWFAIVLKERFNGEICYLPIENHFITKIGDKYYDINGEYISTEKVYFWRDYQTIEPIGSERIKKYCIDKEE